MRQILVQSTVLLLVFAGLAPVSGYAAEGPGDIERWQGDLPTIERALTDGDWEAAEKAAEELLDEMLRANPSTRLNQLVSVALLSQALAEVGTGATDEGLRHWVAAQNLNPELRRARFSAYGEPGAFLERHRLREPGAPPPGLEPVPVSSVAAPPRLGGDEEVPQEWARFELVVDRGGSVRAPVLLVPGRPAAMVEALEAFSDMELEPAEAEGEPVAVYWRPRPEVWVVHRGSGTFGGELGSAGEDDALNASLASCEELGGLMETTGAMAGGGAPFLGPASGMVETLRRKALRQGADTLVIDSWDASTFKGTAFRCGEGWYPPDLAR